MSDDSDPVSKIQALEGEIKEKTRDYPAKEKNTYAGVCSALFMARNSYVTEHFNKNVMLGCLNIAKKTVKKMSNGYFEYQKFHNYVLEEIEGIEKTVAASS